MKTGRPPTPTPLRLLRGNPQHRPINDQEPKPTPIAPRCPSWLSPVAKRHWRALAPELERIGVLTTIDVGAFAGLCESWAQFREASEFLHKHGAVYKTPHDVDLASMYVLIVASAGRAPARKKPRRA